MESSKFIVCYTDASYSKDFSLSVIGYKLENEEQIHISTYKSSKGIAEAEKKSIKECIIYCNNRYPLYSLKIYTDHIGAFKQVYPSNVELIFIKGHKKKNTMVSNHDKQFSLVDKKVRKTLREFTKKM